MKETVPVHKKDHDERELHKYLQQLTRPKKDFVFRGEDTEDEDDGPFTDERVTIVPERKEDE